MLFKQIMSGNNTKAKTAPYMIRNMKKKWNKNTKTPKVFFQVLHNSCSQLHDSHLVFFFVVYLCDECECTGLSIWIVFTDKKCKTAVSLDSIN